MMPQDLTRFTRLLVVLGFILAIFMFRPQILPQSIRSIGCQPTQEKISPVPAPSDADALRPTSGSLPKSKEPDVAPEAAETEIEQLRHELEQKRAEIEQLEAKVRRIQTEMELLTAETEERQSELDQFEAQLGKRQLELDQLEAELRNRRDFLNLRETDLTKRTLELDQIKVELDNRAEGIDDVQTKLADKMDRTRRLWNWALVTLATGGVLLLSSPLTALVLVQHNQQRLLVRQARVSQTPDEKPKREPAVFVPAILVPNDSGQCRRGTGVGHSRP